MDAASLPPLRSAGAADAAMDVGKSKQTDHSIADEQRDGRTQREAGEKAALCYADPPIPSQRHEES